MVDKGFVPDYFFVDLILHYELLEAFKDNCDFKSTKTSFMKINNDLEASNRNDRRSIESLIWMVLNA